MIKKYLSLSQYLILLLPVSLIFSNFVSDLVISILAIIGLFYLYLLDQYEKKILFLSLIWCLYLIIISIFKADNVMLSLESSLFYFRFIFFTVFIYIFAKENLFKYLMYIFLICYLILFFDSIYQYIFHTNLVGYLYDPNYNRITSFFGYDQIMGSYVSRTLPLIICFFLYFNKIDKGNYLLFITYFIAIVLVILSGERVATFFLILIILTSFLILRKYKMYQIYFLSVFLISFALFFIYPTLFDRIIFETYYYITSPETIYFSPGHTAHYITAFEIFKDNLFFGIGPKLFREVCNYPEYLIYKGCSTHPHHIFLQILTEIGILGFLPLAFCVYKITLKYFKYLYLSITSKINESLLYEVILLLGIVNHFNPMAPSGNYFNNILNIYLFLYIAIYLRLKKVNKKTL
jgi:O-antigen ligase